MIDAWLLRFIGIPYQENGRSQHGCDCYGLVRLALAYRWGVVLPSYDDAPHSRAERARLFLDAGASDTWTRVDEPKPGDVLLLRIGGQPVHCALVVDTERMLHTMDGKDACVERYTTALWRNRIEGVYRHRNLTVTAHGVSGGAAGGAAHV